MKDYYTVLGVTPAADAETIKKAYRKLAAVHHPDRGGDTNRFQEIQEAYSVLGDPQKRQAYDHPTPRMSHTPAWNFNNIFDMFGTQFADQSFTRNSVMRMQLGISLKDVAVGGLRTIAVNSGLGQHNIEINLPAGVEDGQSMRYARIGPGNSDLIVTFRVQNEPGWRREKCNLICEQSVDIWDMILGASIEITTLSDKTLVLTLPAMTKPDTLFRVRSHGLPLMNSRTVGDLLIEVKAKLPEMISPELIEMIQQERNH